MRKLDPHQDRALALVKLLNGRAGLFMAPGTGKTLTAIRGARRPALVVCRRDDFMTWLLELEAEGVRREQIHVIDSGDCELPEKLAAAFGIWVLVTYDLVKNDRVYSWIKSFPFQMVIADECHSIKRWGSDRTKTVYRATRHIPFRLALTGSPITNEPLDVFSQCLFIDDGKTFGNNEWKFKQKYYLKSGPGWYKKRTAKQEISERLKRIAFVVDEDDVLKLPPKRHVIKAVPMTGMQRRHYEKVLNEFELEVKGEIIELDQVMVQVAKLKQIASGFVYLPDGTPHFLRCSKLDLLIDMLEDEDYLADKPKVVIAASHRAEIFRIHREVQKMGIPSVTFSGSNTKLKNAARVRFQDDPKCRLFIGQVDALVGMNQLTVADTMVYFSNSHKVVSRQQSMRRIRRRGSERHKQITYYDLMTEGTVDRGVYRSIHGSMSFAVEVLNAIRKGQGIREILT